MFLKGWCAKSKSENINIYYGDGILPTQLESSQLPRLQQIVEVSATRGTTALVY
jgi:hypothetical protein